MLLKGGLRFSRAETRDTAFLASSYVGGCCWSLDHTLCMDWIQHLGLTVGSHDVLAMVIDWSWERMVEQDVVHFAYSSLARGHKALT